MRKKNSSQIDDAGNWSLSTNGNSFLGSLEGVQLKNVCYFFGWWWRYMIFIGVFNRKQGRKCGTCLRAWSVCFFLPRLCESSTWVQYHHSSRIRIHLFFEDQEIKVVSFWEPFCHLESETWGSWSCHQKSSPCSISPQLFFGGGRLTYPHSGQFRWFGAWELVSVEAADDSALGGSWWMVGDNELQWWWIVVGTGDDDDDEEDDDSDSDMCGVGGPRYIQ